MLLYVQSKLQVMSRGFPCKNHCPSGRARNYALPAVRMAFHWMSISSRVCAICPRATSPKNLRDWTSTATADVPFPVRKNGTRSIYLVIEINKRLTAGNFHLERPYFTLNSRCFYSNINIDYYARNNATSVQSVNLALQSSFMAPLCPSTRQI